jgi:hypothetical protein
MQEERLGRFLTWWRCLMENQIRGQAPMTAFDKDKDRQLLGGVALGN